MRVFVSHAGRDRAWAEWAAWQLDHAGWDIEVELDCWDWQAGDNVMARMGAALDGCDRMLALFSAAYFEPSRWTTEEWTAALHAAKERPGFLVPVRIDDTPAPGLLGPLIAPSLHGLSVADARAALLAAVRPPGRPDVEPPKPDGPGPPGDSTGEGPGLPGEYPPVWGPVPAPNEAFTGRDALLVAVREGLRGSGRSVVHALYGEGGVGKTQLAVEYAHRFAADYDAVWWVDAEVADRIGEAYAAFAVAWNLADPAAPVAAAVAALRRHCLGHGRWLVVLDNAVDAHAVDPWRLAGPGHTLVTSRDPHWTEVAVPVAVDVLTRAESITLLRRYTPEPTGAERLAEVLGDLPLALTQAAGTLTETGMSVQDYLDELAATPGDVLDDGVPVSYPVSLARSVRVAVARLTEVDPAAAQLLTLCGFFGPEPIPAGWFRTAAAAGVLPEPLAATAAAPLAYGRALRLLRRYGLAKLADDRLTVHRLTQLLLRADVLDAEALTGTAGRVLGILKPGRPSDPASWPAWADILPHLGALDLAGTDDERLAWQACEASGYLRRRGEVRAHHDLIAPLHTAWHTRLGPTARPTLWAGNQLSQALIALGRSADAVTLNRELLSHYRAAVGDDDLHTLATASHLANALRALGEHRHARDLHADTLGRYRRVLGDDHPNTLGSANNVANALCMLGEYRQARDLQADTLDRFRRVLGDDHPDTLGSADNLALALRALGEYQRARDLHADTLDRRRRVLGDDHPGTLVSATNLALVLDALNEPEQAERWRAWAAARRRPTS